MGFPACGDMCRAQSVIVAMPLTHREVGDGIAVTDDALSVGEVLCPALGLLLSMLSRVLLASALSVDGRGAAVVARRPGKAGVVDASSARWRGPE